MKAPRRLPIFCSGTVAVLLKCRPSNSLEGVKSFFFPLLFSYSFSLLFRLSFVSSTSLHPPPVPFFFFSFPTPIPGFLSPLFSPTTRPLLLFPRLAAVPLHLFSNPLFFFLCPPPVPSFNPRRHSAPRLAFPADFGVSVLRQSSGNINNPTGCVKKPQWAEAENRSFSG